MDDMNRSFEAYSRGKVITAGIICRSELRGVSQKLGEFTVFVVVEVSKQLSTLRPRLY